MGIKMWTAEEDAELLRLLAEGLTSRAIGAVLNRPRNSVIGRANRLQKSVFKTRDDNTPKKIYVKPRPITLADSLLALRHGQCRWPLERSFCEKDQEPGRSYCAAHNQISYHPVRPL